VASHLTTTRISLQPWDIGLNLVWSILTQKDTHHAKSAIGLLEIMTLIVDGLYACSYTYAESSVVNHLVRSSPAFSVSVSAEFRPSGGTIGQKLRCITANIQVSLPDTTAVGLTFCIMLNPQYPGYRASNVSSLNGIASSKSEADEKFVDESGCVVNSKVPV
jgi:hypothetical protein